MFAPALWSFCAASHIGPGGVPVSAQSVPPAPVEVAKWPIGAVEPCAGRRGAAPGSERLGGLDAPQANDAVAVHYLVELLQHPTDP